jgi:hypothetical protein
MNSILLMQDQFLVPLFCQLDPNRESASLQPEP